MSVGEIEGQRHAKEHDAEQIERERPAGVARAAKCADEDHHQRERRHGVGDDAEQMGGERDDFARVRL